MYLLFVCTVFAELVLGSVVLSGEPSTFCVNTATDHFKMIDIFSRYHNVNSHCVCMQSLGQTRPMYLLEESSRIYLKNFCH